MRRALAALGMVVAAVASLNGAAAAGGLRCSVGEVVLENLKIGHEYSLRSLANLPLTLTNTADHPVRVAIQPLVPDSSELRREAGPVGSASWARVAPDTLEIGAGQSVSSDIVLKIPDDESLFGKRFQILLWSHTLPTPNDMIAVGLKSRVIFSIDAVRDSSDATPNGDLAIEVSSLTLDLTKLARGRPQRLEDLAGQPMTVRNTSGRTLTVELGTLGMQTNEAGRGYEDLMSVISVRFDPQVVTLAPGEAREVSGTVTAAQPKRLKGRRFAGTVTAAVTNLPVRTEVYSSIHAETR